MIDRSLRYRIVTGSFTLPVTVLLTLLLWVAGGVTDSGRWLLLVGAGLSGYLFAELNNRYSLLRLRSRMISVSYLVVLAACPVIWRTFGDGLFLACCMLMSYFLLFASYQKTRPEGLIFYAFLFCAVNSLACPHFVLLAAGYWISMLFQLRNMTWRTFAAGLFGLVVPCLLVVPLAGTRFLERAERSLNDFLTLPEAADYTTFLSPHFVTLAVVGFLTLAAVVHFFRTSYNDKIKTRMFYYVIATQELILTALMALRPQDFAAIFTLWAANSSFFLGHYFALARGRFFNLWFYACGAMIALLAVFNHLVFYSPQ